MTVTHVSRNVGEPYRIQKYQFLDPMRDRVPMDQRVDLNQARKHNGEVTFLMMPSSWIKIEGFPDYRGEIDPVTHADFHEWIHHMDLWTLLYSTETAEALIRLLDGPDGEKLVCEIRDELYPILQNDFIARAHGRPGTYTSGCRGPLCRAVNTISQRKRYLAREPDAVRKQYEDDLMQIRASYEGYIKYLKWIMEVRRAADKNADTPYKWWHSLSLKDTLVFDVTDESVWL